MDRPSGDAVGLLDTNMEPLTAQLGIKPVDTVGRSDIWKSAAGRRIPNSNPSGWEDPRIKKKPHLEERNTSHTDMFMV